MRGHYDGGLTKLEDDNEFLQNVHKAIDNETLKASIEANSNQTRGAFNCIAETTQEHLRQYEKLYNMGR